MLRDITDNDQGGRGRPGRALVIAVAVAILVATVLAVQPRPASPPSSPRPTPHPLPRSAGLLAMDVRGYSDGLLATGGGVSPTRLWRTSDGGRTWSLSVSTQSSTGYFDRVRFFDARRGYALVLTPAFDSTSNTLMVTSDGGASWVWHDLPKPSGMSLADFYQSVDGDGRALFSDATNGYFGLQAAALYSTQDGSSWSLVAQVDINHFTSNGLSVKGSKGPMAFLDAEHGAILSQLDVGTFGVYTTADGGRSWSLHSLAPPAGNPESIGAAAANLTAVDGQFLLGVAFRQSAMPATAAVYRSTDGGATWSKPIEVPTTDGLSAPMFAGQQVWWVPDSTGVEVTSDGGRNWIRTELGLTGTTQVRSVYPIDDRRAWAFAGGSFGPPTLLYETTDGGTTWSLRTPPG